MVEDSGLEVDLSTKDVKMVEDRGQEIDLSTKDIKMVEDPGQEIDLMSSSKKMHSKKSTKCNASKNFALQQKR